MKYPIKDSGFSLVELVITIFLLGAIVLVVANIPNAIRLITTSQSESKVREVAANRIEDLRLAGFDTLANGTTTINDSRLKGLTSLNAVTTITDCPLTLCPSGEQVKKVALSFSWSENNSPKSLQIVTLIAKGGLR